MSDDYLWDKSGPPDPEIVALERALARVDPPPPTRTKRRSPIVAVAFALAAAFVLVLGGWWWSQREPEATTPIATVDEEPPPVVEREAGRWIETGAEGSKTVAIATLGFVELDPHTRLRELEGDPGEYRYELERGRIHARVDAPPRVFVVETPAATAVDLGCQYTLEVDEQGTSRLEVSVGFVSLEHGGRECIVPAGARCETKKGGEVGTPVRLEASEALRDAVALLDRGNDRAGAIATILREATNADAATLWHVLRYASEAERPALFDRLAAAQPPPETVTRERILAGDDAAMRAWWSDMGLGKKRFRSPR
jgi:FecR-like protein